MALTMRQVTAEDARLLWEWRNDPDVRRQSFVGDPVPWETHVAWLVGKLTSPTARLWIAEQDGCPVGQIRYERSGDEAEISLSVVRGARGLGVGQDLLRLSAPLACRELGVRLVYGVVKEGNVASLRAFEGARFTSVGHAEVAGEQSVRFEYLCSEAGRSP